MFFEDFEFEGGSFDGIWEADDILSEVVFVALVDDIVVAVEYSVCGDAEGGDIFGLAPEYGFHGVVEVVVEDQFDF